MPMTTRLAAALRVHRHLRSTRILCQSDGSPVDPEDRPGPRTPSSSTGTACEEWRTPIAPHILFTLSNARNTSEGDSGTRRPSGSLDDAAIHALESSRSRERNSTAGSWHDWGTSPRSQRVDQWLQYVRLVEASGVVPRAPTARALRQNREGLTRTASGERALLQTLQQRLVGKDPCFFFARLQPLSCFSRRNACSRFAWRSK